MCSSITMQFQLELTVFYVCFLLQKAVITNVSPDILYLFRVQAVCQHDLRSDFSQTLLFRGMWSQQVYSKAFVPSSNALIDGYINILCPSLFCFTANTTRIFEGSRIVKTGMVSWPEDGSAHFFLHLSDVHVIFCWVTISPPPSLPISLSPQFLLHPQQTWLQSVLVPPRGRPLVSTSPLSPWQQGWAPLLVAARPRWHR